MTQEKVLVIGEDDSKTDYYASLFSVLKYDVSLCKDVNELFQLTDSHSPNLLFWVFGVGEAGSINKFLMKFQQKYAEKKRPKIILATALTDFHLPSSSLVDWIMNEPILITDFRELLEELLSE